MFGTNDSENFFFAVEAETLTTRLEEQLNHFVGTHKNARLIIIDTLQKVKEVGGDKFSYADDYQNVTKLKAFSDKHGICILLVHHTRKLDSSDSFERISGTNGLLGAADGAVVMEKEKRTDNKATLEVAGRDQRINLEFDREHCLWKFVKTDIELWKKPPNPLLDAIAGILTNEKDEWTGSATELLKLLPGIEMEANVLTRALNIAVEDLAQDYGIQYSNKHTSKGSFITFRLMKKEPMTVDDDMTVISAIDPVSKISSQSSPVSQKGASNEENADII